MKAVREIYGWFRERLFYDKEVSLDAMMKRCESLYEGNGGIIIRSDQFSMGDETQLDDFESTAFEANQKFCLTRQKYEVYEKDLQEATDEQELDQKLSQIRKFLRSVGRNLTTLKEIQKTNKEQVYISYYDGEYHLGMNKNKLMERDQLIGEVHRELNKFNDKIENAKDPNIGKKKKKRRRSDVEELIGEEDEDSDEDYDPDYVISVQGIKQKILNLELLAQEKMREANKNLQDQLEIAKDTRDDLKEGNKKLFEQLIPQSEKILEMQAQVEKKMDKAIVEASGQVKWVVGIVSGIICLLFIGLGVVIVGVVVAGMS